MGRSWFKDYQKYIEDIRLIKTLNEQEVRSFAIVFKFPNGYGVRVTFESDPNYALLDGDYDEHAINVNVAMINKDGNWFTSETFEKVKNQYFPNQYEKEYVSPIEVEEYLEKVWAID